MTGVLFIHSTGQEVRSGLLKFVEEVSQEEKSIEAIIDRWSHPVCTVFTVPTVQSLSLKQYWDTFTETSSSHRRKRLFHARGRACK